MESSTDKEDVIERLLKMKSSANIEEGSSSATQNPQDALLNFSPEEMELLANLYKNQTNLTKDDKNFKSFLPEPGFCLKTKNSKSQEKVFLNICKSNEISAPKEITEQELLKLIEEKDPENAAFHFRVPMSLGESHSELDNSGVPCIAFDICINPNFYKKVMENATFMGFLISIALEGLEEKYSIKLDRDCKMLKNKKFMGKIQEQYVRSKSKPLIAEMNDLKYQTNLEKQHQEQQTPQSTSTSSTFINNKTEISNKNTQEKKKQQTPKYKIIREPAEGQVEFLVAEIELPNIISSKSLILDIGEDRILLTTRSAIYYLDIYLPFNLNQDECGAQFDRKTSLLTITIPVVVSN